MLKIAPFQGPYFEIASKAYIEHVGLYLHIGGYNGDNIFLYIFIISRSINEASHFIALLVYDLKLSLFLLLNIYKAIFLRFDKLSPNLIADFFVLRVVLICFFVFYILL